MYSHSHCRLVHPTRRSHLVVKIERWQCRTIFPHAYYIYPYERIRLSFDVQGLRWQWGHMSLVFISIDPAVSSQVNYFFLTGNMVPTGGPLADLECGVRRQAKDRDIRGT